MKRKISFKNIQTFKNLAISKKEKHIKAKKRRRIGSCTTDQHMNINKK